MTTRVGTPLRVVTVLGLAGPNLLTGLWAVLAPRHWFENFPGLGPALVAGVPPFNAHLSADAGAGFLATGVALAWAAATARRSDLRLALVASLVFTVPHTIYHAAHEAPALSGLAQFVTVAMLGSGGALAALLLWWIRTPHPDESADAPSGTPAASSAH